MPSGWFIKNWYRVRSVGFRYTMVLSSGRWNSPGCGPGMIRFLLLIWTDFCDKGAVGNRQFKVITSL